ncbi:MAG: hypothetical protein ABI599_08180 [Flavobacteriales bacterium]
MIAVRDLRSDLGQLRALIERRHPAPYRYTSKERMDRWFDSVRTAIAEPMNARAFLATITTLYPLLGDGHTMFLPGADASTHSYLPVEVMLLRDSLFVRCDGPAGSGVVAGERILVQAILPVRPWRTGALHRTCASSRWYRANA